MIETIYGAAAFLVTILFIFSFSTVLPVQAQNNTLTVATPEQEQARVVQAQPDALDEAQELNQVPVIIVWDENYLHFGEIGNPQRQVNIRGNVRDPDETTISSITYRLNDAGEVPVDIGTEDPRTGNPRLVSKGDFNIAIDTAALLNGPNKVQIIAVDSNSEVHTKTVSVVYTPDKNWPERYSTNWAAAAHINAQAQITDGQWEITPEGVRPTITGYDRVIAIGNLDWSHEYEVLVPVTVHSFMPVDSRIPSDTGGVGVFVRWQGHIDTGSPPIGWTSFGAYGLYSNRRDSWALRLNSSEPITVSKDILPFSTNVTYMLKLRAETRNGRGRYSFKSWVKGQPEPSWDSAAISNLVNVTDSPDDLLQGSVLFVAHRVDATFGNVDICPLNINYALNLNTSVGGTAESLPSKSNFQCGEGVTITARPEPGYVFSGWSGDVTSNSPDYSFNMTKAHTITANFRREGNIYLPNIQR